MGGQLAGPYWTCKRKVDHVCYRSIDGQFEVRNTWSVEKVRERNWLLIDLVTGQSYSFFVRAQVEHQIKAIRATAGHADIGSRQHD